MKHEYIGDELHRMALEQEQAIARARAVGSFVTVFAGKDGKKHYKASCDLTQEDIEASRTICTTGSMNNLYGEVKAI